MKRKKTILSLIFIPFLSISFIFYMFYLILPSIIEVIIPSIASLYGISNLSMNVDKLNWYNIELRKVKIGNQNQKGIEFKEILFKRSIKNSQPNKLLLSGGEIELNALRGKYFIPGLNLRSSQPTLNENKPLTSLLQLPSGIESLLTPALEVEFKKSFLILNELGAEREKKIKLPLSLNCNINKSGAFLLNANLYSNSIERIISDSATVKCKSIDLTIKSSGSIFKLKQPQNISTELVLVAKDLKFYFNDVLLSIPKLVFKCNINQQDNTFFIHSIAKFANGTLTQGNLSVTGISFSLPFNFSYSGKFGKGSNYIKFPTKFKEKGQLLVKSIKYKKLDLGNCDFAFTQKGLSVLIEGFHKGVIENEQLSFVGEVRLPFGDETLSVGMNSFFTSPNLLFEIDEYSSLMGDYVFNGGVKIKSKFKYHNNKTSLSGAFDIIDADFESIDKDLYVKKLNFNFEIPNLLELRSSPTQKITFKSIEFGDINLGEGNIQFQLESKKSLFIEKSTIAWCGGNIDTGGVRCNFDELDDLDFTLYCDRIKISDLLNQLNIAKASGGGAVVGRIPLKYKSGKLKINKGFLYTIPGEGGVIQISDFTGSEVADANIQLAIAKEALKEYKYQWIRFSFNTIDDSLKVTLELNGQPARLLPFTYNKKMGIVKSTNKEDKARFKQVSFDINFLIPINDIIYYSK